MTDEDKCSRAADLFYQHIERKVKENPDYTVENMSEFAYDWAMCCGFSHPKCFVKYIEDIEHDKANNDQNKKDM